MLADILHKIAAAEFQEKKRTKFCLRPSLAGPERCIRQLVYEGLGYKKKPLSGRAAMIFDDSSWHEELTADWIRKTAYKLHSEQMHVNIPTGLDFLPWRKCEAEINGKECGQVIPKGNIAGHDDGILTDFVDKDILWEHKAINHFTFGMFERGKKFPLDNITQTCIYLKGLQEIQPELTDALLLIKNKNTSQFLEYYMTYDLISDMATILYMMNSTDNEKIMVNQKFALITHSAFMKFAEVNNFINRKVIPPREYERTEWRCEYCPYGELCWEGWEEEIDQMESDAVLDEEMETMANYYLELSMHEKEAKTEKDALKKKIKAKMKEKNIKNGKAGKYVLSLSVRSMSEQVRKAYSFEVLNIRLKKES